MIALGGYIERAMSTTLRRNGFVHLFFCLFACQFFALGASDLPSWRIGVVLDGGWERASKGYDQVVEEVKGLTEKEFHVEFPKEKQLTADWDPLVIEKYLSALMNDPEVDIVLTMGPISSHLAAKLSERSKPVVAPYIVNERLQGLERKGEGSGIPNLAYVSYPSQIDLDLNTFYRLTPFSKLTVLASEALLKAIPHLTKRLDVVSDELGIEVEFIGVNKEAEEVLEKLDPGAEAVYMVPLVQLQEGELELLIEGINARQIPSFSLTGAANVKKGVMAGLAPESDMLRLARRVSLMFQSIFLGEDPSTLPVELPERASLTINLKTVRKINAWPPNQMLIEADVIEDDFDGVRRWSIEDVVRRAMEVNLDLAVESYFVAEGQEEVVKARSQYLPQVLLKSEARTIDNDRAVTAAGDESRAFMAW